ncbi:MAG: hypothetical protein JWL69_1643 [Phycisphaerales bacterium]|jgi:ABC-type Co2+ transport system permease subunit|nr:hypothetical protein [Phycisphaerales bacterium]MDB5354629.1 hypothetical protein [Phycisphaerales bacterium]
MSFQFKTSIAIAALLLASANSAMAIVPKQLRQPHFAAPSAPATAGQLDLVMVLGAVVVVLMLFCRAHERLNRWLAVGTILGAMMAAVYGFMVGAWPLGLALGVYSIAHFHSSFTPRVRGFQPRPTRRQTVSSQWNEESRIERMFGRN